MQTAYSNGGATAALAARHVATTLALTGVKHLHAAAAAFDVGVYFEANGHGSVLFSARLLRVLRELSARSAAGELSGAEGHAVATMRAFVEVRCGRVRSHLHGVARFMLQACMRC